MNLFEAQIMAIISILIIIFTLGFSAWSFCFRDNQKLGIIILIVGMSIFAVLMFFLDDAIVDRDITKNMELIDSVKDLTCKDLADQILKQYIDGNETNSKIIQDVFISKSCKYDISMELILK